MPSPGLARDEVEQLARTVNEMLDRIGEGILAQRRFTSDAAHELRTPLMALQGEIEIAKRYPESSDDESWTTRPCSQLVSAIASTISYCCRRSTSPAPIDLQPEPIYAVVQAEAHDLSAPIEVVGDQSMIVTMDQRLMAHAIRNLFSNALRHADQTVRATVVRIGERVWLYVDDDGRGIEPAEREHVFQRFGRLDEGRSADAGGAGLGPRLSHRSLAPTAATYRSKPAHSVALDSRSGYRSTIQPSTTESQGNIPPTTRFSRGPLRATTESRARSTSALDPSATITESSGPPRTPQPSLHAQRCSGRFTR